MAKSNPRDKRAGRRAAGLPPARPVRRASEGTEPRSIPAPSEISQKMQQLSEQIHQLSPEMANAIREDDARWTGPHATGAEVIDSNLLAKGSRPASAQVVTIDAYPHPDRPDSVIVRLDGWDGFLLLTLTRDRATLLANRLGQAVDKSRAWYGPSA